MRSPVSQKNNSVKSFSEKNDLAFFEAPAVKFHQSLSSIFQDFENLSIGEELAFNYSKDPVALLEQLEEQFYGQFNWKHIKEDPELWFISIVRTCKDVIIVRDVLAENPKAYSVLKKCNLDVSFKGHELFSIFCKEAGVSIKQIINEIEEIDNNGDSKRVYQWPLDFLIEYIVVNHHNFLKEKIMVICNILNELKYEDKQLNPFVFQINLNFINIQCALLNHIKEEEEVIFPAIRRFLSNGLLPQNLPFKTLQKTISFLQEEDNEINVNLKQLRNLINNYNPEINHIEFCLLKEELLEFEMDLHYHLHLENNILFPQAIFLEDEANIWD